MTRTFMTLMLILGSCFAQDDPSYQLKADIGNSSYHGCALAISKHLLITCEHNVNRDGQEILIKVDKNWLSCTIKKISKRFDIAILECSSELTNVIPFNDDELKECDATVKGTNKDKRMADVNIKIKEEYNGPYTIAEMPESKAIDHGTSGSPVVKDGKVVGMVTGLMHDDKKFYFIDAALILTVLQHVEGWEK